MGFILVSLKDFILNDLICSLCNYLILFGTSWSWIEFIVDVSVKCLELMVLIVGFMAFEQFPSLVFGDEEIDDDSKIGSEFPFDELFRLCIG